MLQKIKNRVLEGAPIHWEEALYLAAYFPKEELYEASAEITRKLASFEFDMCSIVNAKCKEFIDKSTLLLFLSTEVMQKMDFKPQKYKIVPPSEWQNLRSKSCIYSAARVNPLFPL